MLKSFFRNKALREELGLSGVNSINFARVVAQMVYYFTSAAVLGGPLRKISFTVPTGNFGDILAGYMAKQMGLPVEKLIVATNSNDILARALAAGRYEVRGVHATQSPSMDIQVSSNFERLLFDAVGRDPACDPGPDGEPRPVRRLRDSRRRRSTKSATNSPPAAQARRKLQPRSPEPGANARFCSTRIRRSPSMSRGNISRRIPSIPMVALGTAHPAKFPDAVRAATGVAAPLPAHLADLFERRERFDVLPNDVDAVAPFHPRPRPRREWKSMAVESTELASGLRVVTDAMPGLETASLGRFCRAPVRAMSAKPNRACPICSNIWPSRARGGATPAP